MVKRRLSREERRRQILQATYQCILNQGLAGTRVKSLVKTARVNQAVIFSHFSSMKELYANLLDTLLDDYLKLTETHLDGKIPTQRINAIIELGREFATTRSDMDRVYYDFWVQSMKDPFLRKKMIESYKAYRLNIKRALNSSTKGRRKDQELALIAAFVVGILEGGAIQLILDPKAFDARSYFALAQQVTTALVERRM